MSQEDLDKMGTWHIIVSPVIQPVTISLDTDMLAKAKQVRAVRSEAARLKQRAEELAAEEQLIRKNAGIPY
jgi:hypothetical protein